MKPTLDKDPARFNPAPAADRLRWGSLPWPARRLTKRFGLGAATARVVAEMIGYAMEDR